MATTSLSQRDRVYGPVAGFTVFLHHKSQYRKLTTTVKDNSKSVCIRRVLTWVALAKHTLDIMLFSIFHKEIVQAIIKKHKSGVICRILIYKHVLEGPKKDKIGKYVQMMKVKGIQIRLVNAEEMPEPHYRIIMINYIDPIKNRVPFNNEAGFVVGQQPFTLPNIQSICNDVEDIHVSKEAPVRASPWPVMFEDLWSTSIFWNLG